MRIRLGILDGQSDYAERLVAYFNLHYAGELEVCVFRTAEEMEHLLKTRQLDVLLADSALLPETYAFPETLAAAYFADSRDIETIRGIRCVCRYQRAGLLYQEIIRLYATLDTGAVWKTEGEGARLVLFRGASGGVGTTTVACAYAKAKAAAGKKVLFLDLEENGTLDGLLSGEGTATLSDVLYEVKSRGANLSLKLGSMVRRDRSGVCFYEPFTVTLDAAGVGTEEAEALIGELVRSGGYDLVVGDVTAASGAFERCLRNKAGTIYLVGSGTKVGNIKLARLVKAMSIEDDESAGRILPHTEILYNRFGPFSAEAVCDPAIGTAGHIGDFACADTAKRSIPDAVSEAVRDLP